MDSEREEEYSKRKSNTLPIWGNPVTMNLNPLILTNIQNSPYFKSRLPELKTYHEVVDEIYYKVNHLEPWEKGSRRTSGQTGMCGGVRGVGAGGIISTAYCLLYKLFMMKITRNQVVGLMNHSDSPYLRGLGFMYIRFTQPPADLWEWLEPYLEDPEEIDVRAGGGQVMTIGEMSRLFLTKLDWFSCLFPRIPVPIQIGIDKKLAALKHATSVDPPKPIQDEVDVVEKPPSRQNSQTSESSRSREKERVIKRSRSKSRSPRRRKRSRSRSRSLRRHNHSSSSSRRRELSRERSKSPRSSGVRSHSRSESPKRHHSVPNSHSHRHHHHHHHGDRSRDRR